ncbi:MAG: ComEC/Rec2 family competence protein [Actinomycetota bacterium]|nr:ComEC/Rec2 family competence protein [Actinomycetota bacterium]
MLWAAAAATALGSALSSFRPGGVVLTLGALSGAILVTRRPASARLLGILLLGTWAGAATATRPLPADSTAAVLAGDIAACSINARVIEHAGGLGTLLEVRRATCGARPPLNEIGLVVVDRLEHEPASTIAAKGWFLPLGDDGFSRARARLGALATFDAREIRMISRPTGLAAVASSYRRALMRTTSSLDSLSGALLEGLTIGETSRIDEATEHRFRRTGLAHLVAVSGSNVAIVLGAVALATAGSLFVFRIFASGLVLFLFVLVVGPEPSVLRAVAMGTLGLVGLVVGRPSHPLQALAATLIVLVCLRPHLLYSVGLHLSAAATAGLVLWARPLGRSLAGLLPSPLAYALAVPAAAQSAVAPILATTFGEISLVAPLANLAALPAVPPATVLGFCAGAGDLLHERLGVLIATIAEPFARWILWVAEVAARPEWASVRCPRWAGLLLAVPVSAAAALTLAKGGRGGDSDR